MSVWPISVFGAMIGIQTGRGIEILNSYELVTMEVNGDIIIDKTYYETKTEQCKFLGWMTRRCLFLIGYMV